MGAHRIDFWLEAFLSISQRQMPTTLKCPRASRRTWPTAYGVNAANRPAGSFEVVSPVEDDTHTGGHDGVRIGARCTCG
jgi:hypothetical protein